MDPAPAMIPTSAQGNKHWQLLFWRYTFWNYSDVHILSIYNTKKYLNCSHSF